MINQILKQKYNEWRLASSSLDISDFVSAMATELNTNIDTIKTILSTSSWFSSANVDVETILKQQYDAWKAAPVNHTLDSFISILSTEYSVPTDYIQNLLSKYSWAV
jgi:hypothetical protein